MLTHKNIDKIGVVAIALSLIITVLFMNGSTLGIRAAGKTMGYEERLFSTDKVHSIDIIIDDWEKFISTAQSEEYSMCSVIIDGEAINNVGIRGKGNTSLSTVSKMDSERYSFKIEFDQYDDTKSYYGLDKLCLNNLIQDNTYMKDYLTYQMMNAFDVAAPLCSYVYITVNGEDWGLYLAVEALEESFLQRNYGSNYGELYKPDSMSFGGSRGNGMDFDMSGFMNPSEGFSPEGFGPEGFGPEGFSPEEFSPEEFSPEGFNPSNEEMFAGDTMSPGDMMGHFGGMGSEDVKLQYIDDNPNSYANIFDSAKTNVTETDKNRLISSLKQLSEYENLSQVVNIEDVMRYFVVHNFVVNGDSYTGNMIHNYYLYEENGQLSMLPWDYNLAFGSFQGGNASSAVNDDIDAVLSDRPMQAWIFSDETYSRQYYELYKEMLDQIDIQAIIDNAYELILDYVKKDATAFCTVEEFQAGVDTLKEFCALRSESVRLQLAGSTEIINTDNLNISEMGTMSNGMGDMSNGMGPMNNGMGGFGEHDDFSEQSSFNGMDSSDAKDFGVPDTRGMQNELSDSNSVIIVLLVASVVILAVGLIVAFKFKC